MNNYQSTPDYHWLNVITSMMATVMAMAFMARLLRRVLALGEPSTRPMTQEMLSQTKEQRVRRIGARSIQDIPEADQDAIMELRQRGLTVGDIAWRVGYLPTEVFRVLWRYLTELPRSLGHHW